jgi:hypothetical protein
MRLLSELKGKREGAVKIYIHSESAISKHIDTRYRFIHECIVEGRVCVTSIGTTEQLADITMKALARERFCELCAKLGLVKLKQVRKA